MDPSQKVRRITIERLEPKSDNKAPTEEEIKTYFEKFGTVEDISADENRKTGFVEFSNAVEAERALVQPIYNILGCDIRVRPCVYTKKTVK